MPAWNLVVLDAVGVTLATDLTVSGTLTLTLGTLDLAVQPADDRQRHRRDDRPTSSPASSLVAHGHGLRRGDHDALPASRQLDTLTLSNANGLALEVDLTIGSSLVLTTGQLDAGARTVAIAPGGSVTRTSGWVIGSLQKHVPAGSPVSVGYEIGDVSAFAPLDIAFGTVATAGELTASTTPGDHPDHGSSGLSIGRGVNRYWTASSAGLAFDTYAVTLTFVPADVDAGADPTLFMVAKRDGLTWTLPAVGARSATTTEATGISTFSDFAIGEPTADLSVSVSDGLTDVIAGDGLTHAYVITVDNAGPVDATGVAVTDIWPVDFTQGSITPSQGTCTPIGAGADFDCDLGTVAAGGSVTVTVEYTVAATIVGGIRTNAVTVGGTLDDPATVDNDATDATTVVELALLVVTKDDALATVIAGTAGHTYTISIQNQGPSNG